MPGYHYNEQDEICPDADFCYLDYSRQTGAAARREVEERRRKEAEEAKRKRLAELRERKQREKEAATAL